MNSLVIIDYGVGNLFGLKQACLAADLNPVITSDKKKKPESKTEAKKDLPKKEDKGKK